MKLMACNSNTDLSKEIASILKLPLTDATIKKFADEEMFVEINENVRGQDIYIIQSSRIVLGQKYLLSFLHFSLLTTKKKRIMIQISISFLYHWLLYMHYQ